MYREILEKIKEYDKISIFRHQRPDGDAMFSALALESFIRDNYPDKQVKLAGEDKYDLISKNDRISLNYIRESLAFCLDTSNAARIDDGRWKEASFKIKIDHHPLVEKYADINMTRSKASACAEILAKMFMSDAFKGMILSKKTCEYIYCGMISDTINFRTTNVTAETMSIASKLIRKGDLNISDLVCFVQDKDIETYVRSTKVRSMLKIDGKFGHIVLKENDIKKLGLTVPEAKNNIDEIGTIKDLNIWALAMEIDGRYDCSVRSKRGFVINEVCIKYGGGGHINAAACKNLNKKDLENIFKELTERSIK